MHGRIELTGTSGSIEAQIFPGAGGEAVNAQVCKTCIRGFNPRPALQPFRSFSVIEGDGLCAIVIHELASIHRQRYR